TRRLALTDDPAHGIQSRRKQFSRIKRRLAGQQFVEQHSKRIDVTARVNVQCVHLCLLRTHVSGRANELLERGKEGLLGQALATGGFGNSKVNHLWFRYAIPSGDEDIGRLEITMDDSFLMRVLNSLTDLYEKFQTLLHGELFPVAVVGDPDAVH